MTVEREHGWVPFEGDGNAAYLDKTLRYGDVELSLDDGVSWQFVLRMVFRAVLAATVVGVTMFVALSLMALISQSAELFALAMGLTPVVSGLVCVLVLALTRIPEPVAEWRVLLADRATSAESVYSQIAGTLRIRQSPIGGSVRRIRTGPDPRDVSSRLVLTEGVYSAYVSVFPYGTSLYLGWTMWRSRKGIHLLIQFIKDILEGLAGRDDPERRMMRTERPRAMREAVHAACREGLFVGVRGAVVPPEYGFPGGLPSIDGDDQAVPIPGGRH